MRSCGAVLSILCAITLIQCAPIIQEIREETVEKSVAAFNNDLKGNFIFKLKSIENDFQLEDSNNLLQIKFTIQETVCLNSENQENQDCPFKPAGEIRFCILFTEYGTGSVILKCNTKNKQNKKYIVKEKKIKGRTENATVGPRPTPVNHSCLACIFSMFPYHK